MSEHVLKVLLSELNVVRVRCLNTHCAAVVETTLDRLDVVLGQDQCPMCHTSYGDPLHRGASPLRDLLAAMRGALRLKACEIEFVLPAKPGE